MENEDKLKNMLGEKLISFQIIEDNILELVFENGYYLTIYPGWEPYDQTWLNLIVERIGE